MPVRGQPFLGASMLACALAACGGSAAPPARASLGTAASALSNVCPAVPVPGVPLSHSVYIATPDQCLGGTSDGLGNIGLGSSTTSGVDYFFFSPSNVPVGSFFASGGVFDLLPMQSGYEGLAWSGGASPSEFLFGVSHTVSLTGLTTVQSTGTAHEFHHSLDYGGGSLVVFGNTSNTGNHFFSLYAQRFDSTGHQRSAPKLVESTHFAPAWVVGAVNLSGHSLVVWDGAVSGFGGDHLAGQWLDRNGVALTAIFDLGSVPGASDPSATRDAAPLFDNSVAVQVNGTWRVQVRDAVTTATFPPLWMGDFAQGRALRLLQNGKGYAAYVKDPFVSFSQCSQNVVVLAPDGTSCGVVAFDVSTTTGCLSGHFDVGRDGTPIQGMPVDCSGDSCICTHRFWPHLFH